MSDRDRRQSPEPGRLRTGRRHGQRERHPLPQHLRLRIPQRDTETDQIAGDRRRRIPGQRVGLLVGAQIQEGSRIQDLSDLQGGRESGQGVAGVSELLDDG